jgi:hypothetical protein
VETIVVYVVQCWIPDYEYWSNCAERESESMFALPRLHYESEEQGRARLAELTAAFPGCRYRLIRQTTTNEEI